MCGKLLHSKRLEKGLSAERLARELGVSRQTIVNWENGLNDPPFGKAIELADVLGVSVSELEKAKREMIKK